MIGDPLVIPCSEEPIRILDECPVTLATPQHYIACSFLQGRISSVMICVGVSIDRHCQS